jgi:hypothetical protein
MSGGLTGNVLLLAAEIVLGVPLVLVFVNRRKILGLVRELRTSTEREKERDRRS